MTTLRTAAQQALEAMHCAVPTGEITLADWMKANRDLKAALVEDAMQKFTDVNQELEAALTEPVLQTCNCRWDGEMQMQQCTLHEAHVDAIKEWAQRAKFAEKKLAALAEQRLTDMEQKMERSIESLKTALAEPVPDSKHATIAEWSADKQRSPLTEEEIYSLFRTVASPVMFARAIERAHGIG